MSGPGEIERQEERMALEWLLVREQAEDARGQLRAACELLQERTGMSDAEVIEAVAKRRARHRLESHHEAI